LLDGFLTEVLTTAMENSTDHRACVRLSKLQWVAACAAIAEVCLIPLAIVVFISTYQLSRVPYFESQLNGQPRLSFLRDQYAFLLTHGVDQFSAAASLRLYEFFIYVALCVIFLRLVLSPLVFDLFDVRKVLRTKGISIVKFYLSILFLTVGVWASMDLQSATNVPVLWALLRRSPYTFVFLETASFLFTSIAVSEGLIALVQIGTTKIRNPKSSSSPTSKR
jgi:hypothetical protein